MLVHKPAVISCPILEGARGPPPLGAAVTGPGLAQRMPAGGAGRRGPRGQWDPIPRSLQPAGECLPLQSPIIYFLPT